MFAYTIFVTALETRLNECDLYKKMRVNRVGIDGDDEEVDDGDDNEEETKHKCSSSIKSWASKEKRVVFSWIKASTGGGKNKWIGI